MYLYLINETHFAIVSAVVMTVFGIVMLSFFLQLETPSSVESNFQEGHMFSGFTDAFNSLFQEGSDDIFPHVGAIFGIEGLDSTGVPRFSSDSFRGTAVFDPNFEIMFQISQDFIIDYCNRLSSLPCDAEACNFRTLILERKNECFTR